MDEELKYILLPIFLIVVMVVVMVSVSSQLECTSKAKALGYKCEWGLFKVAY